MGEAFRGYNYALNNKYYDERGEKSLLDISGYGVSPNIGYAYDDNGKPSKAWGTNISKIASTYTGYNLTAANNPNKSGSGWGSGSVSTTSDIPEPVMITRSDYFKDTANTINNAINASDLSTKANIDYDKLFEYLETIAYNTGVSAKATKEMADNGIKTTINVEGSGADNSEVTSNTKDSKVVSITGGNDTNIFTGVNPNSSSSSNSTSSYNSSLLDKINRIASGL